MTKKLTTKAKKPINRKTKKEPKTETPLPVEPVKEKTEDPYPQFKGQSAVLLIKTMKVTGEELDDLQTRVAEIQKVYDHLRYVAVPEAMDHEDLKALTVDGVGRVSLTPDIWASIDKDRKLDAYRWLRDHGHGDLIGQSVNGSSLKAMIRQLLRDNKSVPEDLFHVTPFTRASITKA